MAASPNDRQRSDGDPSHMQDGTRSLEDSAVIYELEQYCNALQRGEDPDRDALLSRYPAIANELAECLEAMQFVRQMGPSLETKQGAQAVPVSLTQTPKSSQLGDFQLVREAGRGGMGIVYEAQQISLERRVAVKVLPFAAALSSTQLQRFKNEALAAASLDHPHIVHVYTIGCERAVHFYAMQFIDGLTLAQVLRELRESPGNARAISATDSRSVSKVTQTPIESGASQHSSTDDKREEVQEDSTVRLANASNSTKRVPLAIGTDGTPPGDQDYYRTVARLGIETAEALQHAHELGVVHRDIKPSNLMIDERGHVWVTDFGLAQTKTSSNLTITGDLVGTLRYMSPEQIRGERELMDHRVDVYSLGITLYELLTLQPAFPENDRQKLMHQVGENEPPMPRQVRKTIPRDLETIVLKAISKQPRWRYASAQQLADDLHRFLDHEPIAARRPRLVSRVARWSRRHRAITSSAVAVLLTAVVFAGGLFWRQYQHHTQLGRDVERTLTAAQAFLDSRDLVEAEQQLVKAQSVLQSTGGALPKLNASADAMAETIAARSEADEEFKKLQEGTRQVYAELYGVTDAARVRAKEMAASALGRYDVLNNDNWRDRSIVKCLRVEDKSQLDESLVELLLAYARLTARPYRAFQKSPSRIIVSRHVFFPEDLVPLAPDPDERSHGLRDAMAALQRVHTIREPSRAVYLWLASFAKALGDDGPAVDEFEKQAAAASSNQAFDFFALAEYYAAQSKWDEALENYEVAIDRRPNHYPSLLATGLILLELGKDDLGLTALNGAIAVDAGIASVYVERGNGRLRQGKAELADADYDRACKINSRVAHDYFAQARTYTNRRDYGRAINMCDSAIRIIPHFAPAYRFRADARFRSGGDWEMALSDYAKAIQLKPEYGEAYAARGFAHLERGEFDKALADCQMAVKIGPLITSTLRPNLAGVYARRGEYDKAIQEYQQALTEASEKDRAWVLKNLSTCYRVRGEKGDTKKQIEYATAALDIDPQLPTALYTRGHGYAKQGDLENAIADYSRAIDINPQMTACVSGRGLAHAQSGNWNEALADLKRAIELDPNYANAHFFHGSILLDHLGKPKLAINDFTEFIKLRPNSVKGYRRRGMAHLLCGDNERAIADFTMALKLDPKCSQTYSFRHAAYVVTKDYRLAGNDVLKATELEPDNATYRNAAAWFLLNCPDVGCRDSDRALKLATEAVAKVPDDADFRSTLGVAHYRHGDFSLACKELNTARELRPSPHPVDELFVAMAQWQLKNHDVARKQFEKAQKIMKVFTFDSALPSTEREELQMFHSEAAGLMGIDLP